MMLTDITPTQDQLDDVARAAEIADTGATDGWPLRGLVVGTAAMRAITVSSRTMSQIVDDSLKWLNSGVQQYAGRAIAWRHVRLRSAPDTESTVVVLECGDYRLIYVY